MAKRLYFGWYEGVGKESNKPYKRLCIGQESEQWHGIVVNTVFVPTNVKIPGDLTPGQMIDVIFNEFGGVEEVTTIKEK